MKPVFGKTSGTIHQRIIQPYFKNEKSKRPFTEFIPCLLGAPRALTEIESAVIKMTSLFEGLPCPPVKQRRMIKIVRKKVVGKNGLGRITQQVSKTVLH